MLAPLVRPVVVERGYVLADHGLRVALVVDQHVVGVLAAEATSPAFDKAVRLEVRGGVLTTVMPSAVKTSSKAVVYLASRSSTHVDGEASHGRDLGRHTRIGPD